MINWSSAINRKYNILQQNADTAALEGQANAANTMERTRLIEPTALAAIGLQGAETQYKKAQAADINNLNKISEDVNFYERVTRGLAANPASTSRLGLGLAKGTARVPGKGSPKKDTVPAMLAPGEAVLNQPAAEGLGRGLIALLNAAGQQKMGMV